MDSKITFYFKRTINYSDDQIACCATEFAVAGDPQSLPRFAALAPRVKVLAYRDVRTTREKDMLWMDWLELQRYIVRSETGDMILDNAYPYLYLLDLTCPACQNLIAHETSKRLPEYAGIYLDEAASYAYPNRYSATLPQSILSGWRQGMSDALRKIKQLAPPDKVVVGNVGNLMRTLASCRQLDYAHDESTMGTLYDCK